MTQNMCGMDMVKDFLFYFGVKCEGDYMYFKR